MGQGRFVNHKLGKNVGRRTGLLKSDLAGRGSPKAASRLVDLRPPKKQPPRAAS